MNENNKGGISVKGGIGFFGALTLIFIVLKLTKVISWSWVWVLAPLWIPAIVTLVVVGGVLAVAFAGFSKEKKKFKKEMDREE